MSGFPVGVRTAEPDELAAVMNVLDGAMLETDASTVEERIGDGEVLVAVDDGRTLGACVLEPRAGDPNRSGDAHVTRAQSEGAHVAAVAVRPGRRNLGIGRALIEAAADRHGRLSADFDERVRPFYASLGFSIEADGDRYVGTRSQ